MKIMFRAIACFALLILALLFTTEAQSQTLRPSYYLQMQKLDIMNQIVKDGFSFEQESNQDTITVMHYWFNSSTEIMSCMFFLNTKGRCFRVDFYVQDAASNLDKYRAYYDAHLKPLNMPAGECWSSGMYLVKLNAQQNFLVSSFWDIKL